MELKRLSFRSFRLFKKLWRVVQGISWGIRPSSGLPLLTFLLSGFICKILPSKYPRERTIHDGDESVDKTAFGYFTYNLEKLS